MRCRIHHMGTENLAVYIIVTVYLSHGRRQQRCQLGWDESRLWQKSAHACLRPQIKRCFPSGSESFAEPELPTKGPVQDIDRLGARFSHSDERTHHASFARGRCRLVDFAPLSSLHVLVLRDMGHRVAFTWTDFFNLFAGSPNLHKLAVVNVRCSDLPLEPEVVMPRLDFLNEVYVCFGSHTSFKHVLGRMRCMPGLSLRLHAMMELELEVLIRCANALNVVTSFTYSGWACDSFCMHIIFEGLPSLTRLTLLGTNVDILDSLLPVDDDGRDVHLFPNLRFFFFSGCLCGPDAESSAGCLSYRPKPR